MADNNIPAYPYMFSPDQFTNKFSNYAGKALPWPSQYMGTPTDAQGRPIQSYLDAQAQHDAWAAAHPPMAPPTTLNTNPVRPQGMTDQQAMTLAQQLGGSGVQGSGRGTTSGQGMLDVYNQLMAGQGQTSPMSRVPYIMSGGQGPPPNPNAAGGAGTTGAAAGAAPQNPIDMNQAYLNALSSPGRVATPGATAPQGPPPAQQSNVLQQFLQNWQNKGAPTTGAGNYNNQAFFNALQGGM